MTKDELISILELRFTEQTHALGYKILLERIEEINKYLSIFGFRLIVGGHNNAIFIKWSPQYFSHLYPIEFETPNSIFLNRLEELKQILS